MKIIESNTLDAKKITIIDAFDGKKIHFVHTTAIET
jgi:hypothetical protein